MDIKKEIEKIISKDIGKYSIMKINEDALNKKYGEMFLVRIDPTNIGYDSNPIVIIPGYSNKSFLSMLEVIIKNYTQFNNKCILMLCWGTTVKQLSDDIANNNPDMETQYKMNEEFRINLAKIFDKIIRSIIKSQFYLIGKSAGSGIAIYISSINTQVTKLFLCCPATTNGCKPLATRLDLKIFLSWNQDDKTIEIKDSFRFMEDMNSQGNKYTFYSYVTGGHEINSDFIRHLSMCYHFTP